MSQETTGPNPFCQLQCPKVNLCNRAILRGEMWQGGGDPRAVEEMLGIEDIEQDTVDGVYTKEEAIKIVRLAAPIGPTEADRMREAGQNLSHGFTELRRILMETCTDGPEDVAGQMACRSEKAADFMFTEEDLR